MPIVKAVHSSLKYTVRGIPRDVDRALRQKAKNRGVSLNRILVEALTSATGLDQTRQFRSLRNLSGQWREDPGFDRALDEQRVIDPEMWR